MHIRAATPADLVAILAIYNDAVSTSTALWDTATVDLENRRAWMAARHDAGFPVLVAEREERVVGYGSFGPFRPHAGYAGTVEHSLYVAASSRGRGVGNALLTALIEAARAMDKRVMVGAIDGGNSASIALHERLGFEITGRMPGVGEKFGRRLDLVLMQRELSP